jgi:CHAD domain-containing protein/CYTH domain-containing protein
MPLPPDLLQRSPEESARRIALELLAAAQRASQRLDDPDDPEALHDFRVAVRRLRSVLRAWRPQLRKSAGKRHRRALRALQTATGEGRDAEVALEWLSAQRDDLGRGQRRGHDWLVRRLSQHREASMDQVRERVRLQFEAVEQDLRAHLEHMTVEVNLREPDSAPRFGELFAEKTRQSVEELVRLLADVTSPDDQDACHQARIACKRLRYLVEPLRPQTEDAVRIVKRCKRLQDVLGDLHDAHVLRAEVASSLEEATLEHARRLLDLARDEDADRMRRETRRDERAGLLEIARRVELRIRERFEALEKEWLSTGIDQLAEQVEVMARRLESGADRDVEIERKYLLSGLPTLPEDAASVEVDQGWLPGARLRERVRRTRRGDEVAYFRAVKLGQGLRRIEIEEPTSKELFERLWTLTLGCRVRKRRYLVRDGDLCWEIDQFRDRPLVLAEVELPSVATTAETPEWLAGCVVREVTDDVRYTNLHLAERPGWVPEED